MTVEFVKGQDCDFIAQIDFALNFDDRTIKSVKVKKGESVKYDGEIASCMNRAGETVSGRCSSLKSAINIMKWLLPQSNNILEDTIESDDILEDTIDEDPKGDFDEFKGGNFNTFMKKNKDDYAVVGKQKHQVIKEEDLVVGKISVKKDQDQDQKRGKLEVALDQNAVKKVKKDRLIVSSSTIQAKERKSKPKIIEADEMNADSTQPLKGIKGDKKDSHKKSFTVDSTTPRTVNEDMTLGEVRKITKVINADESQDAQVISKIDRSNIEVKEVDGITLRKTKAQKEDIKFTKTKSPKEMSITTTVGSGATHVYDSGAEDVEIGKVSGSDIKEPKEQETKSEEVISGPLDIDDLLSDVEIKKEEPKKEKNKEELEKRAKERAEQRKKSANKTQSSLEKDRNMSENEEESSENSNYLLMLPDNWKKLHWVKKEKFVKEQNDIGFLKHILSETKTKAVQNACKERLIELEQEVSG